MRISSTMAHRVQQQRNNEGLEKAAQQLKKGTGYRNTAMQYGMPSNCISQPCSHVVKQCVEGFVSRFAVSIDTGSKTEAVARDELQEKLGGRIVQVHCMLISMCLHSQCVLLSKYQT